MSESWKKNLGRIVSKPYKLTMEQDGAYEDLRLFYAPCECYGDVNRGFDAEDENYWAEMQDQYGITKKEVAEEFKSRVGVSYRMYELYTSIFGLGEFVD